MFGNNNQSNTEDINSEIRKTQFLVQENKRGISQEWKNIRGI